MLKELLEERIKLKQMVDKTPTEAANDQRSQLNCLGKAAILTNLTGDKNCCKFEGAVLILSYQVPNKKITFYHAESME